MWRMGLVALMIGLFVAYGCDPGHNVTYENRTSHEVTIFWNGFKDFSLKPGEKRTYGKIQFKQDTIEARDELGQVIYSESLTWDSLKEKHWKIVITEAAPVETPEATPTSASR